MIKYIFFDLDDTIFDFKKAERIALAKALREFGVEPEDKILSRYSEINISQWKLLELGKITRQEVKVRRYKLLFDEFGIDLNPDQVTALYEKNLGIGHYFIDGAEETVKSLFGKYQLYIVSNGATAVQESRLASSDIVKYFDDIFISQKVGYDKPDVRFFEKCFESIDGFSRDKAIIVGDSLSSDIQGGINAGIKTVWFNPKENTDDMIKPDFQINDLKQLPTLIESL
ncbi:MAG: YjjG family noncanonical pyrimidine nucleotidase [Eubacterium sp.]